MKAVSYARVSSREQAEGYSLSSQQERINEYALRNDLTIVKRWKVSESAKKEGRKAFDEMINFVKENSVEAIILEKIDRVARNFKDIVVVQDLINGYGKEFHFVREGITLNENSKSSEKFTFDIQAVLARNYINNLSDEVKKGMDGKLRNGGWPGSAPIGYKNNPTTRDIDIDEERAPFIRKAFELYATNVHSLKEITDMLHKEGLRQGLKDKPVSKATLHHTLKNPFYIGTMIWKGKSYRGKHEPLVNEDLFEKVQEVFSEKERPRKVKRNFQFSGLIKCGVCGSSYTTEIQKEKYIYYRCTEHHKKHKHKYWKEEELHQAIKDIFNKFKIPKNIMKDLVDSLKASHLEEIKFHKDAINGLKRRLDNIQRRKDQLYDDKLDELITKDEYIEKMKAERKTEKKVLRTIKRHKKANKVYFDTGIRILELIQKASLLYEMAKPEEKRELLEFVFSNFTITNEKLDYTCKSPFSEIIKYTSRSEWSGRLDLNQRPLGPKPSVLAI